MFVGRAERCIRRVFLHNMSILGKVLWMLRGLGRTLYLYDMLSLMHDIGSELAHYIFLSESDLQAVES